MPARYKDKPAYAIERPNNSIKESSVPWPLIKEFSRKPDHDGIREYAFVVSSAGSEEPHIPPNSANGYGSFQEFHKSLGGQPTNDGREKEFPAFKTFLEKKPVLTELGGLEQWLHDNWNPEPVRFSR